MFRPAPAHVLIFFANHQPLYTDWKDEFGEAVSFRRGLPSLEIVESLETPNNTLVVIGERAAPRLC